MLRCSVLGSSGVAFSLRTQCCGHLDDCRIWQPCLQKLHSSCLLIIWRESGNPWENSNGWKEDSWATLLLWQNPLRPCMQCGMSWDQSSGGKPWGCPGSSWAVPREQQGHGRSSTRLWCARILPSKARHPFLSYAQKKYRQAVVARLQESFWFLTQLLKIVLCLSTNAKSCASKDCTFKIAKGLEAQNWDSSCSSDLQSCCTSQSSMFSLPVQVYKWMVHHMPTLGFLCSVPSRSQRSELEIILLKLEWIMLFFLCLNFGIFGVQVCSWVWLWFNMNEYEPLLHYCFLPLKSTPYH